MGTCRRAARWLGVSLWLGAGATAAADAPVPDAFKVNLQWGVQVPVAEGVTLSGTLYRPTPDKPAPCLVSFTPYIAQTNHRDGVYFAARGFPTLVVDVRGRGNSGGQFQPFANDGADAEQVIRWLAAQPYCDGRVATWGGSYPGYVEWAAAVRRPPELATIVPVSAPYPGKDFPGRGNILQTEAVRTGIRTAGRTAQDNIAADSDLWNGLLIERFRNGEAFNGIEAAVGLGTPKAAGAPAPSRDFWARLAPSDAQLQALEIPVLTITGAYDVTQWGALEYYRRQRAADPGGKRHYLVIGPWDHAATRAPRPEIGGLKFGPASLIDLRALHTDWYRWVFDNAPLPAFLQDRVAYYVSGAEVWRYAGTLDEITAARRALLLSSDGKANRLASSGKLGAAGGGAPDRYRHDPRDTRSAAVEVEVEPGSLTDKRLIEAADGKQLVYQTEPFTEPVEIAGFFEFDAWLAIDQPDTDFCVSVYEIGADNSRVLLASDLKRARFRESLGEEQLIETRKPLRYRFDQFNFIARRLPAGSRLQLIVAPINSFRFQKNYNAPGDVSAQTLADARTVTVSLLHDAEHASVLHVPIGRAASGRAAASSSTASLPADSLKEKP